MNRRPLDAGVLAALSEQQARLADSPARRASLDALAGGACRLVATGQQVGLFLGPLYTFYKAASALRLAQRLEQADGARYAALFWMATEDHDIAEVDHCFTVADGETMPRRIALDITFDGALDGAADRRASADGEHADRVPLAHRRLGPSVARCLDELAATLTGLPHADDTMALLSAAYRPEQTFGAAFAEVLGALFADDGLLLFDPRDARVAAAAAPLYGACLRDAGVIAEALRRRVADLRRDGARAPVHVRPGAPLCFVHPRGADGPRFRLEPANDGYQLVGDEHGGTWSLRALEQVLARDPLCFSSSALLRPVLQDALLPVSHTVGGPSEVDYLAQLPPLYAALAVEASEVVRRCGFRLLPAALAGALRELALTPEQLCAASDDELDAHLARLRAQRDDDGGDAAARDVAAPQVLERELLGPFEVRLDRLDAELGRDGRPIEPSLRSGIDKTRESVRASVARLVGRYRRALAADDAVARSRVARARAALMPGGTPQERALSLPYFLARYGAAELRQRVLAAIDDPHAGATLDLTL